MKPTTTNAQPLNRRGDAPRATRRTAMPEMEHYFRAPGLTNYNPCGGDCGTRSFRDISNGYFQHEAPRASAADAAVFAAILLTVTVPLFNSASAIWQMLHTLAIA
jgi:hypothetical protein